MPYQQPFTMVDELPPLVQVPSDNYYNQVVQDHPGVARKIRNFDSKPFGKLEETFSEEDYRALQNPPAVLKQNYLSESMIPKDEAQHLPVAKNYPSHYIEPIVKLNTNYPVVEPFFHNDSNCPFCKKYEKFYLLAIGVLILMIFILLLFKRT